MFKKKFLIAFIFVATLLIQRSAIADELSHKTINQAASELRAVYEIESHVMAEPPSDDPHTEILSAAELLKKHDLITPALFKHIENIGGLDFDILTSSQDWDLSWKITVGEPVKDGTGYNVPVVLDRGTEKSSINWKFLEQNGKWQIDDARYLEPGEKPFSLRDLKEGD